MEPARDKSAFIIAVVVTALFLLVTIGHFKSKAAAEAAEQDREDSTISLAALWDGSAARCMLGYAEAPVQVGVDSCARRMTSGTEDQNEWVGLSDVLYGCLERDYTFAPGESLYETGALVEGPDALRILLAGCADRLMSSNWPEPY